MDYRHLPAVNDGFVPARLTLARQARGLKQKELAQILGGSPSMVSKWESGEYAHAPDFSQISAIALALSVKPNWFYKSMEAQTDQATFFRSLKSELGVARDKTSAKLYFTNEIFSHLSERIEFPEIDVPDLIGDRDFRSISSDDIEKLANSLRDYWGLGDDPIIDLMLLIENAGVAVAEIFVDSAKLDGVSGWYGKQPVMLLAKDKQGGVRRRFDAAHELGHLILHQAVSKLDLQNNLTLIEEQAMAFAGAFLLPASSFSSGVRSATLDDLADVKIRWGTSIGAMIKRLRSLQLISEDHERNLWKYYSYRRWRGNEPYDDKISIETPVNMRSAVEMIIEDGLNEVEAFMNDVGLEPGDISDLVGIELHKLTRPERKKPKLRLISSEKSEHAAAND